ncbi:hypothetical protein MARLIPOL_07469 [Marinobacter lipolyticus SM19]|uniref:DUF192 domain-containing protein n=1 Tax=Marinobacter lipolyticus SM19 TaxID=1318628 RepID=R8B1V7_9GAMM|nr:hypothetical protein MARLIPOL_07469 [Marinobacter lipolyticus SM19]
MSRINRALNTGLLLTCLVTGDINAEVPVSQSLREACLITDHRIVPITVEMAITESGRRNGLMGRESLAPDTGMLFVYEEPRRPDHGFWMYQTLIPLDIAYLDKEGTIVAIRQMVPCRSPSGSGCPVYRAGVSFSSALEMNQSFFRNNGISVGHQLSSSESICKP